MAIQQLLSFSDLTAFKSSEVDVQAAFEQHIGGSKPGISVNAETALGGFNPPITVTYGHPCYKTLGDITYSAGQVTSTPSAVVGTNTVTNNGDSEITTSLSVTGSWSQSTSVSSSVTAGMSFTAGFNIEVVSLSETISLSTTAGKSSTSTKGESSTATVTVTVPAHSKVTVNMVATLKTETINFSAPITATGMFGANYGSRVNGHYFWFLSAASIFGGNHGVLNGTLKNSKAFNVETNVMPAVPIT